MKSYTINISKSHNIFNLMQQPLRNKKQVDLLLLETLRVFLIGNIESSNNVGKIILRIDKMNRFVYELENKIFSINCPFTCFEKEGRYVFKDTILDIEIDSKLISSLYFLSSSTCSGVIFNPISISDSARAIQSFLQSLKRFSSEKA